MIMLRLMRLPMFILRLMRPKMIILRLVRPAKANLRLMKSFMNLSIIILRLMRSMIFLKLIKLLIIIFRFMRSTINIPRSESSTKGLYMIAHLKPNLLSPCKFLPLAEVKKFWLKNFQISLIGPKKL